MIVMSEFSASHNRSGSLYYYKIQPYQGKSRPNGLTPLASDSIVQTQLNAHLFQ